MIPDHHITCLSVVRYRGFALVEVMVAFMITAIGLLGAAYLQVRSVQFGNESQNRSQINFAVSEMIERMRSNMIPAKSASSTHYTAAISYTEILANPCSPATVTARNDTICFLKDLARRIPVSNMQIRTIDLDRDNNIDNYEITVYWSDRQLSQGNLDKNSDEGKSEKSDCTGTNRFWSGDITWWPEAGRTDPKLCLVFHNWQFEVPAR